MKPLFDLNIIQFTNNTGLPLECEHCNCVYTVPVKEIRREIKRGKNNLRFCSYKCFSLHEVRKIKVLCGNCKTEILKRPCEIKESKSGLCFCSRSCSGTYYNAHKTTGYRRSKLEIWIEEQLKIDYPNINVLFNDIKEINAELDIYFPDIKLAVELNGIFHYEPIYGHERLSKTQNNDGRKFQACLEREIELVIMDTSQMKKFTKDGAEKYYKIIKNILSNKICGE